MVSLADFQALAEIKFNRAECKQKQQQQHNLLLT